MRTYSVERRVGVLTGNAVSPYQVKRRSLRKAAREMREAVRVLRPNGDDEIIVTITLKVVD